MATIELKTPDKYKGFLEDSSEFQGIITEVMYDFVEKKQDQTTKANLQVNSNFQSLNSSLELKLGKL